MNSLAGRESLSGTLTQLDTVKKPFDSMSLNSLNPSTIHLGEHSIYILSDHSIWSCGEMANGRLGHPVPDGATVMGKLTKIENIPLISQIAVHPTGRHVLAVTIAGALMSWGDGEYGQTGHGLKESIEKPRLVQTTQGIEFIKIAAGKSHSAAITRSGELYTWGCGKNGLLGHAVGTGLDHADVTRPKIVDFFNSKIVDVACGHHDGHTLAITLEETGLRSVWSWGKDSDGKLGRNCSRESPNHLPGLVKFPGNESVQIMEVHCGANFSVALSASGEIFTWGKGSVIFHPFRYFENRLNFCTLISARTKKVSHSHVSLPI